MSDKEHVMSLIRQAELYRSQGLLEASMERYQEILQFVQNHERFSKHKKLIDAVRKRIRTVEENLAEIERETERPELSEEVQNLIQKLFSFSRNADTAAMEGAIALAKFGQYEKAVAEFERLLNQNILPFEAAKNILRCHLNFSSPRVAIAQFERWVSHKGFSKGDLKYLRDFLEDIFEKRDIETDLPQVPGAPHERARTEKKEDEVLDISSVGLQLQGGPLRGQRVDLQVSFQSGNTISVVIPARHKDLIDAFQPGLQLPDLQCYSLIAVFNGNGMVSGKTLITSGPRQGDYTLDIRIDEA